MALSRRKLCAVLSFFFCLTLYKQSNERASRMLLLAKDMVEDIFVELDMMFLMTIIVRRIVARRRARRGRTVWAWPRPQQWFDLLIAQPGLGPMWKPNFRMEKETFMELCNLLRADVIRQATRMRRPVSVEKRVAVGIWRLATGNSFRSCGLQFGLGKSTAKVICNDFERALCEKKHMFIKFPTTEADVRHTMDNFEEGYDFPQIVGAIDGSHIEIKAPSENHEDYFNRKHYYSVNLQAIVDSELLFRHIAVGFPGSIHDARVLRLSGIFDLAENQRILSLPTRNVDGIRARPMLVGDSAYPLTNWLIKPFPDRGALGARQRRFNRKLGAMRSVVERAFGLLQNRWRIIMKKMEQDLENVPQTVTAACILHNFCMLRGDFMNEDDLPNCGNEENNDVAIENENGQTIREAVMNYLDDEGHL